MQTIINDALKKDAIKIEIQLADSVLHHFKESAKKDLSPEAKRGLQSLIASFTAYRDKVANGESEAFILMNQAISTCHKEFAFPTRDTYSFKPSNLVNLTVSAVEKEAQNKNPTISKQKIDSLLHSYKEFAEVYVRDWVREKTQEKPGIQGEILDAEEVLQDAPNPDLSAEKPSETTKPQYEGGVYDSLRTTPEFNAEKVLEDIKKNGLPPRTEEEQKKAEEQTFEGGVYDSLRTTPKFNAEKILEDIKKNGLPPKTKDEPQKDIEPKENSSEELKAFKFENDGLQMASPTQLDISKGVEYVEVKKGKDYNPNQPIFDFNHAREEEPSASLGSNSSFEDEFTDPISEEKQEERALETNLGGAVQGEFGAFNPLGDMANPAEKPQDVTAEISLEATSTLISKAQEIIKQAKKLAKKYRKLALKTKRKMDKAKTEEERNKFLHLARDYKYKSIEYDETAKLLKIQIKDVKKYPIAEKITALQNSVNLALENGELVHLIEKERKKQQEKNNKKNKNASQTHISSNKKDFGKAMNDASAQMVSTALKHAKPEKSNKKQRTAEELKALEGKNFQNLPQEERKQLEKEIKTLLKYSKKLKKNYENQINEFLDLRKKSSDKEMALAYLNNAKAYKFGYDEISQLINDLKSCKKQAKKHPSTQSLIDLQDSLDRMKSNYDLQIFCETIEAKKNKRKSKTTQRDFVAPYAQKSAENQNLTVEQFLMNDKYVENKMDNFKATYSQNDFEMAKKFGVPLNKLREMQASGELQNMIGGHIKTSGKQLTNDEAVKANPDASFKINAGEKPKIDREPFGRGLEM